MLRITKYKPCGTPKGFWHLVGCSMCKLLHTCWRWCSPRTFVSAYGFHYHIHLEKKWKLRHPENVCPPLQVIGLTLPLEMWISMGRVSQLLSYLFWVAWTTAIHPHHKRIIVTIWWRGPPSELEVIVSRGGSKPRVLLKLDKEIDFYHFWIKMDFQDLIFDQTN